MLSVCSHQNLYLLCCKMHICLCRHCVYRITGVLCKHGFGSNLQALLELSDKAKNLDKQKSQLLNRMQSRNHDKSAQQVQNVEVAVTTPEQAAIQQVYLVIYMQLQSTLTTLLAASSAASFNVVQ